MGWLWHTFRWTSLHCSKVSVVTSCPEDSKHSSFISVEHSSEYSVAHSCVISSWQTSRSTLLQCSEDSTEHLRPGTSWHCAAAFVELKCALLKRFLRVQNISILYLDTLRGSSTHRSWSSHGYDHNSVWPAFWSRNRPPHPDPWNQRPRRPWSPHPQTDVCWYIWTSCSFIWARQSVPFPLCLSIPFRLFWPTFPAPFATSDDRWSLTFLQQTKLLPMKPYLLFAFLMASRKSDPFIFPKIFTNLLAHPCHKYSPQNLPSSVVLPKHRTLQEFWHSY